MTSKNTIKNAWRGTSRFEKAYDLMTWGVRQGINHHINAIDFVAEECEKLSAGKQDVVSLTTLWARYAGRQIGNSVKLTLEDLSKHNKTTHDFNERLEYFLGNLNNITALLEASRSKLAHMRKDMLELELKGANYWMNEGTDQRLQAMKYKMQRTLKNSGLLQGKSAYIQRPFITPRSMMDVLADNVSKVGGVVEIDTSRAENGGVFSLINTGTSLAKIDHMIKEIEAQYNQTGEAVTLIGHSHGGLMAHIVLDEIPEMVSGIITLGSPINPEHELFLDKMDFLRCLVERFHGELSLSSKDLNTYTERMRSIHQRHPNKRFTYVHSQNDGLVRDNCAQGNECHHNVANIEVNVAHTVMAHSDECYIAIMAHFLEDKYPGICRKIDVKNRSLNMPTLEQPSQLKM